MQGTKHCPKCTLKKSPRPHPHPNDQKDPNAKVHVYHSCFTSSVAASKSPNVYIMRRKYKQTSTAMTKITKSRHT